MPNQEILIRKAQAGDVASFEALIRDCQPRLFRLILSVAGNPDDAEDALQETLLQAYRALPAFRGAASFSTWLHRIALNTTRNWIRSQWRASSERITARMARVGADPLPAVDAEVMAREQKHVLRRAVLDLPQHYREVLLLRHYQDMAYEEIAQVLDVPVGTVRSRIAQARKLLLKRMEATGYFSDVERR